MARGFYPLGNDEYRFLLHPRMCDVLAYMAVPRVSASGEAAPAPETHSTRTFRGRPLRYGGKVLPEHARAHNRALVLQTLVREGTLSRADLSRHTGLTRVTISELVAELLADGFVAEVGARAPAGPGKPAILLEVNRETHQIIGIDLSASDEVIGAVLTLDGQIVARRRVAAPEPAQVLEAVIALARELISAATGSVLGVGVGSPGVIDEDGMVLAAPTLGWRRMDLQGIVHEALEAPVVVVNDANAAALAEHMYASSGDDVLVVRIARGVGSGLVAAGRPLRGSHDAAGEIGHVVIDPDDGPACACGKTGCLEAWLAVPALHARMAIAQDPRAVRREAGVRLGRALAPVVGVLDLAEVVLSGPAEMLDETFIDAAVETLRARTLARFHDGVRVRMSEQHEDIVVRGVAVMALAARLGVH